MKQNFLQNFRKFATWGLHLSPSVLKSFQMAKYASRWPGKFSVNLEIFQATWKNFRRLQKLSDSIWRRRKHLRDLLAVSRLLPYFRRGPRMKYHLPPYSRDLVVSRYSASFTVSRHFPYWALGDPKWPLMKNHSSREYGRGRDDWIRNVSRKFLCV